MVLLTKENCKARELARAELKTKTFDTYNKYLKDFKNNKYLLDVFKAMTVIYLECNFTKMAIDFKNTYFKNFNNHYLNNDLTELLYKNNGYEIPDKDIVKAHKVIKKYIENFKKYN